MATTIVLKGDPAWDGLPEDCRVRVESLPDHLLVYDGECTGECALTLDDGRYIYSAWKHWPDGFGVKHVEEFNVGVTGEEYRLLRSLRPQMSRGKQTSQGIMYVCQVPPRCGRKFTNATAAALHEAEHFGMTREEVMANPALATIRLKSETSKAAEPEVAEEKGRVLAKVIKRRGRPPKSARAIAVKTGMEATE